ncbi:peptidase inhibitor family I36 protein [Streptomyces sp. H27-D2]|uniref:peptidase inhibitor family I36 protein n=1 Tax=Streptomyces sp. H27-D2 TaxID=3046304 RepID=UPI002DB83D52|nr:peptidase inhibitor family I36 protein [Streptomyces sp. H27-D2]MEC4016181.1 peptidase inhibitor family I36 protein [Streptomyces sp. H27-D2]
MIKLKRIAATALTATVTATVTAAAAAVALAPAAATATTPTAGNPRNAEPAAATIRRAGPASGDCATGQLCLWKHRDFGGKRRVHELADTEIESCVPLPAGATAASLANRTGRPVTTYQSAECATEGEFATYPSGSWVPESAYQVRAFKVWEN